MSFCEELGYLYCRKSLGPFKNTNKGDNLGNNMGNEKIVCTSIFPLSHNVFNILNNIFGLHMHLIWTNPSFLSISQIFKHLP